jgi:hypothetical protein
MSCGVVPDVANAKPTHIADAMKTVFDAEKKEKVPKLRHVGDKVSFTCSKGFTTTGAKDGPTEIFVECSDKGYFTFEGVCVAASKCGSVPSIPHAVVVAGHKMDAAGKVHFECAPGYSLDGEPVVAGGLKQNSAFVVECDDFRGEYKKFDGRCQSTGHLPASEAGRIYNQVTEVLFKAFCDTTLRKTHAYTLHEGEGKAPEGLDTLCAKLPASSAGTCESEVAKIKEEFAKEKGAGDFKSRCAAFWDILQHEAAAAA